MDDKTVELVEDVLMWLQTGRINGKPVDLEVVVDHLEAHLITLRAGRHGGTGTGTIDPASRRH